MVCTHSFLGVPNSNHVWCTSCGTLKENQTSVQWNPKNWDAIGLGNAALTNEEKLYCNPSQKIQAIKLVRERTGKGLREAKEVVDDYMANHPMDSPEPEMSPVCVECKGVFNSLYLERSNNSNLCWSCYENRDV